MVEHLFRRESRRERESQHREEAVGGRTAGASRRRWNSGSPKVDSPVGEMKYLSPVDREKASSHPCGKPRRGRIGRFLRRGAGRCRGLRLLRRAGVVLGVAAPAEGQVEASHLVLMAVARCQGARWARAGATTAVIAELDACAVDPL